MPLLNEGVPPGLPDVFVVGVHGGLGLVHGGGDNFLKQLLVEVGVGIVELLLADFGNHPVDKLHLLLVFLVGHLDGPEHGVVVHLVGSSFNHDHLFPGGHHGHVQVGNLPLLAGGVENELAVHQAHLHRAHGAVPGDVGNGQGGGSADEAADLRGAVVVHAHDRGHDGNVIAEVVGEQGADGPVNDPAGEDALFPGAALPAVEAAGDAAHGVELFLKVHA